ncbi:S8 family peptidase [Gillisia limnaea]|uniref:Peptidase S8 and S53 subtilisin kexin sedolisin n=1 Tax=Gillisia limnaea (strain DSM 15749 / LMG 21470 / R-8282) TaxID=865937 RepID=H2BX05_GILLR|nr:S8 family serine peptidase [Gillisia limnaea]EHQ01957.1 peptidase S8 and S53 subtilisin kexin sedolisin [Gillisia limnaea DSM 15749]
MKNLKKMALSLCAMGVLFTSCEKDEINETVEVDAVQLEEAPFKNYMVISKSTELTKSVENYLKTSGGKIVSTIPEIGIAIVNSKDANFIQNTLKNKEIVSVVPDYEIKWIPSQAENELTSMDVSIEALTPSPGTTEGAYIRLWGMDAIDAPEAWNAGYTGKGASVFVLDSGIDRDNVEFSQNLNKDLSASFVPGEPYYTSPGRFPNHGTHVAGTIAANKNNFGVIGVAYEAELVAVKVLSEFTGSGAFSSINAGIVYAGNNKADVVNMSLGATFNKNGKLTDADGNEFKIPAKFIQEIVLAQQRAIDYAYKNGVTLIASAGNDGMNYDGNGSTIKLPGSLNNVITISATAPEGWHPFSNPNTNFDIPASYTTYGKSLIDLAAPGGDGDVSVLDMIFSVASGEDAFNYNAGTSMASPHAAGVAALIIGKYGKMSPHEVEKLLIRSSDQVDGNGQSLFFGKGRVNAFRAVTE